MFKASNALFVINLVWSTDDVKQIKPGLTDKQANTILSHVEAFHDKDVGVNRNSIASLIERLLPILDDDLFAPSIINSRPEFFDRIELHGVRHLKGQNDLIVGVEVCDENPDFFSVYLHSREGGVDCIGDFRKQQSAEFYAEFLKDLYGWKISDFSKPVTPEILKRLDGHHPNEFVQVTWDLINDADINSDFTGKLAAIFNDSYLSIYDAAISGAVYFASQSITTRYELEGALLGHEITKKAIGLDSTLYFVRTYR